MTYRLSGYSRGNLRGVDPRLVKVVELAITISARDFKVIEGLRTQHRQRDLVAQSASKTLASKHLDLAALEAGQVTWEHQPYHEVHEAMQQAANASSPRSNGAAISATIAVDPGSTARTSS